MNDFIDDGLEENEEDYSKHISEIFGYDRTKYNYIDDEDDTAMESNFAQQLKEEYRSTKIGIHYNNLINIFFIFVKSNID